MDSAAPAFFDPGAVGRLYLERAAVVAEAAEERRRGEAVRPVAEVASCLPQASLFVLGAVEDMRRAIERLCRNLTRITTLFLTLDSAVAS